MWSDLCNADYVGYLIRAILIYILRKCQSQFDSLLFEIQQETQADFACPDFSELIIDFKIDDSTKNGKRLFIQKIIRTFFSHKKKKQAKHEPTSWIDCHLRNTSKSANDATTELGTGHNDIHEDSKVTSYPAPKQICTDFVADELDKIIADLSVMNADMTDEEHADAMASLLLLRDEARYARSDVLNDVMWTQRRKSQSVAREI